MLKMSQSITGWVRVGKTFLGNPLKEHSGTGSDETWTLHLLRTEAGFDFFAVLIFPVAFPLLCPFRFPMKIYPNKISSTITASQDNLNSDFVDCLPLYQGWLWTWPFPLPGPALCQPSPQPLRPAESLALGSSTWVLVRTLGQYPPQKEVQLSKGVLLGPLRSFPEIKVTAVFLKNKQNKTTTTENSQGNPFSFLLEGRSPVWTCFLWRGVESNQKKRKWQDRWRSGLVLPPFHCLPWAVFVHPVLPQRSLGKQRAATTSGQWQESFSPFQNSQTRFSELNGRLPLGGGRRNMFVVLGHYILN